MEFEDITIVHVLPGRVRLKLAELKNNPVMAREVKQRLSRNAGISRVAVNPITGSILMHYDPKVIDLFSQE